MVAICGRSECDTRVGACGQTFSAECQADMVYMQELLDYGFRYEITSSKWYWDKESTTKAMNFREALDLMKTLKKN